MKLKKGSFVVAVFAIGFASGCATVEKSSPDSIVSRANTLNEVLTQDISQINPPQARSSIDNGEIVIRGMKLKNTQFDIPISINTRVEYWIDYFCGRGRPFFEKYLERSEYFVPYIVPILKQNGMPEDMVYLAMVESGFNNLARSRARAVGPWQFMSLTGQRYGLNVNWWVDERRDIRKSTLAAVGYLKDLYSIFQSWELAAAAYNAGEAKVARGVRRFGSKDFWVIAKHRFLRPETRDYVPKIIAAALISKNRSQFGFPESYTKPAADEAVASDGSIVKVVKTDKPLEDKFNKPSSEEPDPTADDEENADPEITPATLTIPAGNSAPEAQMATAPKPSNLPIAKPVPTPHVTKTGAVGGEELAEFEVQSPADLLKVARAAGLSYQTVKALNPELLRWCTPPGAASYRIKLPAFVKDRFLATYNHEAFPRHVQFLTYKVKRGETLARIARHFGIKVDPISDLNKVSARAPLRSGTHVLLPMPNDRSRTLASLEIRDPPEKHRYHRSRRSHRRFYRISYKRRESARSHSHHSSTDT